MVDAHHMIDEQARSQRRTRRSNRRKELEQLRAENKELLKRIMIKNEQRKQNKSKTKAEVVKKGSHVMSNLGALLNDVDINQRLSNTTTCKQSLPPPSHIDIKVIDADMISSISGMNEQPRLVSPNHPSDHNFFSSKMNDNDLVSFGSTNFFTTLNNTNTATIEKDTLFSSSPSKFNKENDDPFNDDSTPISLSSSTHQQKPEKKEVDIDIMEDMQIIDDLAKRYSYSSSSNNGDDSVKPMNQKDTRVSVVREQHMNEIERLRKLQEQQHMNEIERLRKLQQEQQQQQHEQQHDDDGLIQNSCSDDTKKQDEAEAENDDEFELPFEKLLQEAEKMAKDNCDNEEEEGYIGVVNADQPITSLNKESEALRRVPSLTLRRVSSISSTFKKSIRRKRSNNNKVVDKADGYEIDKENMHPILDYKKGMSSKIPLVQRDIPSALREQKHKSTSQETKEKKTVRFDEDTKEASDVICVHGGGTDNNAHDISYDYDDDDTRDDTITLNESIIATNQAGCAANYFSWLANCGQDDNQEVETHEVNDDDETMDNTMESSLISMDDDDTATTQVSTLFGLHTLVDGGCKFMSISDASKVHTLY